MSISEAAPLVVWDSEVLLIEVDGNQVHAHDVWQVARHAKEPETKMIRGQLDKAVMMIRVKWCHMAGSSRPGDCVDQAEGKRVDGEQVADHERRNDRLKRGWKN